MTASEPLLAHLWIIGHGRLGTAFERELKASGRVGTVSLLGGRSPSEPLAGATTVGAPGDVNAYGGPPTSVLLTVPDGAIAEVAVRLSELPLEPTPVLHTSGVSSSAALAPLAARGHPVGSIHPLVAVTSGAASSAALRGAWYGVEGSDVARSAARSILTALQGRELTVDPSGKPRYHAAAVFASNYLVALLDVAESLFVSAGIDREEGRAALLELATSALRNVEVAGPVGALTGPISRGDQWTIEQHLLGLSRDQRALYSLLAEQALELALRQGLDPAAADRIARTIEATG